MLNSYYDFFSSGKYPFLFIILLAIGTSCTKREIIIKETPLRIQKNPPPKIIIETQENKKFSSEGETKLKPNTENTPLFSSFVTPEENKGREEKRKKTRFLRVQALNLGLEDVHFDFDQANLKTEVKEKLKKYARKLKKFSLRKITIEGHCDERGSSEYNLALGEKRAIVVKKYLISLGINPQWLNTISYGEEKPLSRAHNETAWALNRRAHFEIIP